MSIQIQFRRDSSANWTANNPILAEGEMGIELDSGKIKIGNGSSTWTALSYSIGATGAPGATGPAPFTIVGDYNNGEDYGYGDAVYYQGGTYVRTGNPLNPGYPPTPGAINASWTPLADKGDVGVAGATGPKGDKGDVGSAGTSAYAVYVPAKPYGSDSTASVSIPAGTYLYETPASVQTNFSMNGQSKSGTLGSITTATASTTIAINSAIGYPSYSFPGNQNYSIASDGTTYLVCDNQTNIWRSTDLVNWTAVSLQPQVYYGYATQIVYGNGVFVVGWRYNGQNRYIATSTDAGLTWTFQPTAFNQGFENGQQSTQLIFDGTQFVGLNGAGGEIYTSIDGANWTYENSIGSTGYYGNLSYVGGKYFSWNYYSGQLYVGATPSDLSGTTATFTSNTPYGFVYASPVQYANSTYYWACFSNSTSEIFIYSSSDGLNWSVLRTQTMANQYSYTMFVADGNQILFIDSQGNAVFSSNSGSTWTYESKYFRYGAYYGKKINGVWYFSAEIYDGSSSVYPIFYNSVPISPQQPTFVKLTSANTAS